MPKHSKGTARILSVDVTKDPVQKIFSTVNELKEELERRVEVYLVNLGYKIYKTANMQVYYLERGNMQFVHIDADVEIDFSQSRISLEVPFKHFDSLVFPPTVPYSEQPGGSQYASGHP